MNTLYITGAGVSAESGIQHSGAKMDSRRLVVILYTTRNGNAENVSKQSAGIFIMVLPAICNLPSTRPQHRP